MTGNGYKNSDAEDVAVIDEQTSTDGLVGLLPLAAVLLRHGPQTPAITQAVGVRRPTVEDWMEAGRATDNAAFGQPRC